MGISHMTIILTMGKGRVNKIMSQFTDSPYERLMKQIPEAGRRAGNGNNDKCRGCPYGRGQPCVGICMARMLRGKSGKKKV